MSPPRWQVRQEAVLVSLPSQEPSQVAAPAHLPRAATVHADNNKTGKMRVPVTETDQQKFKLTFPGCRVPLCRGVTGRENSDPPRCRIAPAAWYTGKGCLSTGPSLLVGRVRRVLTGQDPAPGRWRSSGWGASQG